MEKEITKSWLVRNKKDVKVLLIIFVVTLFIYLMLTQDLGNALEASFGFTLFGAIVINAYRYGKKWFGKLAE